MAFSISLKGLKPLPAPETRPLAILDVQYDDNQYEWTLYIPEGTSDLGAYIQSQEEKVKAEIDQKEAEWEVLDPKERLVEDFLVGEYITVPIEKSEIVKPDELDYYAKRRKEYPPIGEQLDAFWKGVDSQEYQQMVQTIQSVKLKYPKP